MAATWRGRGVVGAAAVAVVLALVALALTAGPRLRGSSWTASTVREDLNCDCGTPAVGAAATGAAAAAGQGERTGRKAGEEAAAQLDAPSKAQLREFETALATQLTTPFHGFTFRVPPPDRPIRRAYVVLVMEDDPGHLCGARALMASLRRTNTTADMVAMVVAGTSEAAQRFLETIGYRVRVVPRVRPNVERDGYYSSVFSSINLWSLNEYDCVVKLDTDMIVLTNIDELFIYNHFAATPDYPAGLPPDSERCRETQICQHTSHDFRAQYLNGALLVVQPDMAIFNQLRGILDRHEEKLEGGPSEQGFLNWFFKDKWLSLPHYYNVRQPAIRAFPQLFAVSPPRIFHFIGGSKPWKSYWDCSAYCRSTPLELWHAKLWYPYYNDPILGASADTFPPDRTQCQDHLVMKP